MLNDARIKAAKKADKPYKLADAEQLYLYVNTTGGRLWRMNYSYGKNSQGKPVQKTLSFGAYPAVSLLEARAKRDEAKRLLREGRDPAVERRIVAKVRASETENTFETVARRWYALKRPSWAPIHAKDVMLSLERDAFPYIGDLPITAIKAPKLLEVLQRVEIRGSIETAHRLRQRCSAIFVYGIAAGACDADPAASIGKALQDVPKAKPQPSIIDGCKDYDTRIQAVRKLLVDCEAERCRASTKLAMRLIALTAVRPNELRGARWDEFEDLDGPEPQWRIPAARMKGDKERKADPDGDHLVPLARQSLELLAVMRQLTGHLALVFPGDRHVHHPISDNTLRALLIRAGYYQRHVPHGFRAAFSTIMNERVKDHGQPDDRAVIDLMLAHVPTGTSGSEGAYNRAAYMPRRRELAQEWADVLLDGFCDPAEHLGKPIRFAATGPGKAMEAEAA